MTNGPEIVLRAIDALLLVVWSLGIGGFLVNACDYFFRTRIIAHVTRVAHSISMVGFFFSLSAVRLGMLAGVHPVGFVILHGVHWTFRRGYIAHEYALYLSACYYAGVAVMFVVAKWGIGCVYPSLLRGARKKKMARIPIVAPPPAAGRQKRLDECTN